MESSFNCIGILKMEWAVLQFNNRVAAIPDDATKFLKIFRATSRRCLGIIVTNRYQRRCKQRFIYRKQFIY